MGASGYSTAPQENVGVFEVSVSPFAGDKVLVSAIGSDLSTDWVSVADPFMLPLVTVMVFLPISGDPGIPIQKALN